MTLATVGAGNEAADMSALAIEIFGNGKGGAAAAGDEKHAGMLRLFLTLSGSPFLHSL
jgi:hypothetical protein